MNLSILLPNHNEENVHAFIEEIEKEFPGSQIIIARDRYGKGKGWAVREALSHATGEWICFLDADGDIQARELHKLFVLAESFQVVVGKKRHPKPSSFRGIVSFSARLFIKFLFGMPVDTQTGIKLFKAGTIRPWKENGWLFDIEILWAAKQRGYRIGEVSVECKITKSKSIGTLWKTFLDSLNLWCRLSFRLGK
jgi:hypothetical protein